MRQAAKETAKEAADEAINEASTAANATDALAPAEAVGVANAIPAPAAAEASTAALETNAASAPNAAATDLANAATAAADNVCQNVREIQYSADELAALLPLPKTCDNKYTRGVLDVIAGSAAYPGAAVLAARAGARAGAGYTHVWCAPEAVDAVRFGNASLVVSSWQEEALQCALTNVAGRPHAVLIGCGFTGAGAVGAAESAGAHGAEGAVVAAGVVPSAGAAGASLDAGAGLDVGSGTADTADDEMRLLRAVLESDVDAVVDAGGLTCLARLVARDGVDFLQKRVSSGVSLVLTPHAGEAARLMNALHAATGGAHETGGAQAVGGVREANGSHGANDAYVANSARTISCDSGAAQAAPPACGVPVVQQHQRREPRSQREVACELSAAYGATVVLKGPQTVVAHMGKAAAPMETRAVDNVAAPASSAHEEALAAGAGVSRDALPGKTYLMDCGTPALAKAGTGDVLAGMIAALLAQGLSPFHAGALGSYLHARAGVAAAARLSSVCVIPEDVIDYIPCSVNELLHRQAEDSADGAPSAVPCCSFCS